jgi:hypothetical protein
VVTGWEDRLTPAARDALARWRQGAAESAGFPDWAAFQAHLEAERAAKEAGDVSYDQPPPEVTSRDPRPADAPEAPAILKLVPAADAGWEVRTGYARGYRKVGRGNVGTSADARWELTHFHFLEARPVDFPYQCLRGYIATQHWVRVAYAAPAGQEKVAWKHDASADPWEWSSTVAKAKAALMAPPPQDVVDVVKAALSATRQPVAPATDMFAVCLP